MAESHPSPGCNGCCSGMWILATPPSPLCQGRENRKPAAAAATVAASPPLQPGGWEGSQAASRLPGWALQAWEGKSSQALRVAASLPGGRGQHPNRPDAQNLVPNFARPTQEHHGLQTPTSPPSPGAAKRHSGVPGVDLAAEGAKEKALKTPPAPGKSQPHYGLDEHRACLEVGVSQPAGAPLCHVLPGAARLGRAEGGMVRS